MTHFQALPTIVANIGKNAQGDAVIQLRFNADRELHDWAQRLNDSRWAPEADRGPCWQLPATPSSAFQAKTTAPSDIRCSAGFLKLVSQFAEQAIGGGVKRRSKWRDLDQPEIRVHDSWGHQAGAYHFARENKCVAMLAMGMGTGKSKVAVDLVINEQASAVFVLCPASCLGVWRREFATFAPRERYEILILDDSIKAKTRNGVTRSATKMKVEAAKTFLSQADGRRSFVVVVNYETARSTDFASFMTGRQWDFGILDESHRCKDPNGVTAKLIVKLKFLTRRRLCLTGTPMPHSPADLFAQASFIETSIFGRSFFRFKKRYAVEGYFSNIIGWENVDELKAKFHSFSFIVGDEVLDLPEVTHIERTFAMPKKARKIYEEFWGELTASVGDGSVTADNVLVKLVRAQQITSGFVPLDPEIDPFGDELEATPKSPEIEVIHDAKGELLREMLLDFPHDDTIVVFCRWRYDLDRVREITEEVELKLNGVKRGSKKIADLKRNSLWKAFTYGEVSGRSKCLDDHAKIPEGVTVVGVQVQAGGVGVDFTRAAIAVLYSIDFSLGNYEQMLKRLHRPGQKRPVRFYHLVAEDSIDGRIYSALKRRESVIANVMEELSADGLAGVS